MSTTATAILDRPAGGVVPPAPLNGHTPPHAPPTTVDPPQPQRREPADGGRRFQNLLTGVIALIAIGAQVTGMWNYFGDTLGVINPWLRAGLCAVFELALVVSALRARRYRIDHGVKGIDDRAVWVIALVGGLLSASDVPTLAGKAGRLALPLLGAWLFERAISAERDDAVGEPKRKIRWKWTLESIAVKLGLADALGRGVEDIDRARRVAMLASLAYTAQTASAGRARRRAVQRFRKALAAANESMGLADDPAAMDAVRAGVALLFEAEAATTAAAVADASPWARAARVAAVEHAAIAEETALVGRRQIAASPERRRSTRKARPTLASYEELMDEQPSLKLGEAAKILRIGERQLRNIVPPDRRRNSRR